CARLEALFIYTEGDRAGAGDHQHSGAPAKGRVVGDAVIAHHMDLTTDYLMDYILHPGCIAGNRGPGDSDAEPLNLLWEDLRGFASPPDNAVQGKPGLFFLHLCNFASL